MAARPMVATDVGGIPDIVAPAGGSLVAPDDPDGIAAALVGLVENRDLRRRTGEAARRQAVERFSIERSVEGHWAAIKEALAG